MKILLGYPGPRHSTFDVALGWEEALIELGHEIFAFRLDLCIDFCLVAARAWAGKHHGNPGAEFGAEDWQKIASEQVAIAAADFQPDIALIISGMQYHPRAFHLLGKMGVPKVIILTESPYQDERQALMLDKGGVDLAFANDKASVAALEQAYQGRVFYLPHSYAPSRHFPGQAEEDYETDVFFCGTMFQDRRQLFEPLRSDGAAFDACIIGPADWRGGFEIVPNDDLAEWYRGTKIALNHHRIWKGDMVADEGNIVPGTAWSLNPRAYEIAACGAFQLCDDQRPELGEVFGDSVATYKDGADMLDKINYYLARDAERVAMAREARRRVRHCGFIDRANQVLIPAIEKHL